MLTVPSAHLVHLQDQRTDALRLLTDAKERIEETAAANEILQDVTREPLQALQEAVERLSTWCPELFGPQAPVYDEQCTCWRCAEVCDPFAEGEER